MTPSITIHRALAFTEVAKECWDLPANLRIAKCFRRACETAPLLIQDKELIIGNPCGAPRAGALSPDIAWEWIADEIDTGLDCGVSRDLVTKLCDITHRTGKTTIIISHNIVNIELYDRVVVLAKGSDKTGGIAYAGSPAYIRGFFEVNNYVDILTKINASDEGGMGQADYFIGKNSWQTTSETLKRYYNAFL